MDGGDEDNGTVTENEDNDVKETSEPMFRIEQFTLVTKVGEGSGGMVWKALRNDDGLVYAIKILKNGTRDEITTMEALNDPGHPNIMKYYGWGKINRSAKHKHLCCFEGDEGLFIVMEWIDGATLENKITEPTFIKHKRRCIFKQLLEALVYMHSKRINHGSLFLDNILVSAPNRATSCFPHLTLCDFEVSTFVPEGQPNIKFDQDRSRCGMVLFSLFSRNHLSETHLMTNKLMRGEVLKLARDLIDVRGLVSLESALLTPVLAQNMWEDKFKLSPSNVWNGEIVDNIASHLLQSEDLQSFENASLVCKQFYVGFQRKCLSTFPRSKPWDFKKDINYAAPVEEFSIWLQNVLDSPYTQTWTDFQQYSDQDHDFELDLLNSYMQDVIENLRNAEIKVKDYTFDSPYPVLHHFHSIAGSSTFVGFPLVRYIAHNARERLRIANAKLADQPLSGEKALYTRIIESIRGLLRTFNKNAKDYLQEFNLDLPIYPV